jgi:hypothetical protein
LAKQDIIIGSKYVYISYLYITKEKRIITIVLSASPKARLSFQLVLLGGHGAFKRRGLVRGL